MKCIKRNISLLPQINYRIVIGESRSVTLSPSKTDNGFILPLSQGVFITPHGRTFNIPPTVKNYTPKENTFYFKNNRSEFIFDRETKRFFSIPLNGYLEFLSVEEFSDNYITFSIEHDYQSSGFYYTLETDFTLNGEIQLNENNIFRETIQFGINNSDRTLSNSNLFITGTSESRLNEIKDFRGNYLIAINGSDGLVNQVGNSLFFPVVYNLEGIQFTTFSDLSTIYSFSTTGINQENSINLPLIPPVDNEDIVEPPYVENRMFVDRSNKSVFQTLRLISKVERVEDIVDYRSIEVNYDNRPSTLQDNTDI